MYSFFLCVIKWTEVLVLSLKKSGVERIEGSNMTNRCDSDWCRARKGFNGQKKAVEPKVPESRAPTQHTQF